MADGTSAVQLKGGVYGTETIVKHLAALLLAMGTTLPTLALAGDLRKTVPKDTQLVVLLLDYLNHGLARKVRVDACRLGLPVIYCRRSLGEFCEKLDQLLETGVVVSGCDAGLKPCGSCPLNGKSKNRN